ncbi:MAG: lamin tail domain-containing protein [Treponema sp.]|nr:lamin tail domain-containing protein [Treponema sp.]MCL2266121.1 lamin tail domain-containing protein [Treponema sp.]
MRKIKLMIISIIAVLASCFFTMGCGEDDNKSVDETPQPSQYEGKLLILQAYGNVTIDNNGSPAADDSSPAGASHSFIELYNTTEEEINLDGINLYYANGIRGVDVTEDWEWEKIALEGTIPAGGSFLILGNKHDNLDDTRYIIDDDYGDMDENFYLSRRSFKVVLIEGSAALNMQNPFNIDGSGEKAPGYIDMVGALNNPDASPPDNIFGFETTPARCSASEAVRRKNLTDTNDNSADFIAARYGATSGANITMTDEEFEARYPRNSTAGSWEPFEGPLPPENPTEAGEKSEYAGKLLILQAGASTDGAITRSFVELYNNTETDIDLETFSLQYGAIGTSWKVINLTGAIPAKGSYLIRGPLGTTHEDNRLFIENADQTVDTFILSNNGFKIALMENQDVLTVENPFAMTGGTAADYVDMLGAYNSNASSVDAFEAAAFTSISKQAAARRRSLNDTDNNLNDFERIDYKTSGINNTKLAQVKPRYSADGEWSPFPPPPPGTEMLMILQIGAATDGNISHSFIELYNNTNSEIDLTGYSIQYAAGFSTNSGNGAPNGNATTDGVWQKIDLTGIIPPRCSFLILGTAGTMLNPALNLGSVVGDMAVSFTINNRCYKVLLIKSTTILSDSIKNPFDTDGAGTKVAGYIDMVGAINTNNTDNIQGFEGTRISNLNKQTGQRRKNLADTDNNFNDFEQATYLGASSENHERLRPKNLAYGSWNPITGEAINLP